MNRNCILEFLHLFMFTKSDIVMLQDVVMCHFLYVL